MAKEELVANWLKKADEDFFFASKYLPEEKEFFAPLCFHFYQAGEKYLKTYIVKFGLEFKKIHIIGELLNICIRHDNSFKKLKKETALLDSFYQT